MNLHDITPPFDLYTVSYKYDGDVYVFHLRARAEEIDPLRDMYDEIAINAGDFYDLEIRKLTPTSVITSQDLIDNAHQTFDWVFENED